MPMTDPYSFQLYSARNFPPIASQLAAVAALGFTNIEPYRDLYTAPHETRAQLDANGLTAKTGHFGIDALEDDLEGQLNAAAILGIETVIAPSVPIPLRDTDEDGWKGLAERLAVLNEKVTGAGFRFGWHNHHWEFKELPSGRRPIELLLGESIGWEMDCAWVARAGQDPLAWMERYKGRILGIHFKDIAPEGEKLDEQGWADPGTGTLPLAAYWRAAEAAGATLAVAEHDDPKDYLRFAAQAIATMKMLQGEG